MKNKGKNLYLIFMTLFLAITMAVTSTITLAYFGSTGGGTATISLANPVDVDGSVSITSPTLYVVPSEHIDINAKATVKSPGSADGVTDGLLRAKVEALNNPTGVSVAVVGSTTVDSTTVYWHLHTDGYYYLVTGSASSTNLYTVKSTTTGKDVPLKISVIISSDLKNGDSGKQYNISVTFCVIQARIYNSTGTTLMDNTISNTVDIFESVEGN